MDTDAALAACEPGDELASLLGGARRRESELATMRQEVHEEMSVRMDTGVRVNHGLAKALGVDTGGASADEVQALASEEQAQQPSRTGL